MGHKINSVHTHFLRAKSIKAFIDKSLQYFYEL